MVNSPIRQFFLDLLATFTANGFTALAVFLARDFLAGDFFFATVVETFFIEKDER